MNFGGTNGIKGNLTHMNEIPFQALDAKTTIWGALTLRSCLSACCLVRACNMPVACL